MLRGPVASWTLGAGRANHCDAPAVGARPGLTRMRTHQRHLHCGLHGAHRRLARRRALSRVSKLDGRSLRDRRARGPDRAWRFTTPSATACATAATSATRSPTCRAAPPTSRARSRRSPAASTLWKAKCDKTVDRARGAVDPLAAEIGELGGAGQADRRDRRRPRGGPAEARLSLRDAAASRCRLAEPAAGRARSP